MSLLIVPLLYPDLAGLLNFSHPFQHNCRVAIRELTGSVNTSALVQMFRPTFSSLSSFVDDSI